MKLRRAWWGGRVRWLITFLVYVVSAVLFFLNRAFVSLIYAVFRCSTWSCWLRVCRFRLFVVCGGGLDGFCCGLDLGGSLSDCRVSLRDSNLDVSIGWSAWNSSLTFSRALIRLTSISIYGICFYLCNRSIIVLTSDLFLHSSPWMACLVKKSAQNTIIGRDRNLIVPVRKAVVKSSQSDCPSISVSLYA